MQDTVLTAREIQKEDIQHLMTYWFTADAAYMHAMGADIKKLPEREQWAAWMSEQIDKSYKDKESYCIIWLLNNKPVGHSNVNKIVYGKEAYMHLHLWTKDLRHKGTGHKMIQLALPWFFKNLNLQTLYCEPYSLNPAPNKTLEKAGFIFRRSYTCVPGSLNFEQEVNLWEMSLEHFNELQKAQL